MARTQVDKRPASDAPSDGSLLRQVGELLAHAAAVLDKNTSAAADCIHQASALLSSVTDGPAPSCDVRAERHVLAPWQAKRVSAYIDENLGDVIAIKHLAAFTRLSGSYFFRAFKGSFGVPPHAYIIQRRIMRAQLMLIGTDEPLGQIAVACGLADQAHFSRLFGKAVGVPPGVWRRQLRGGAIGSPRAAGYEG